MRAASIRLLSPLRRPPRRYARSQALDALRGLGIFLMVIFHFCYDLTLFGLAEIPIYSDFYWIAFRYCILTLFLSSVGMSLYLHHKREINWLSYRRRLLLLAANALLITAVTYITLREQYIFFGILHLIAVSSLLGLLFLRLGWLNLLLGLAVLFIGFNYGHPIFNQFGLRWLGMLTVATGSADFTPIFPWFGLVLLGMFIAYLLGNKIYIGGPGLGPFALAGRYGLWIYMLHQPILWGILYIYITLVNLIV